MAKYKLKNPDGTPLDPFRFEKQFATPKFNNNSSLSGVSNNLEFDTPVSIEEGYGGLGNALQAVEAYNERQYREQGSLELLAKGIGRTLSKAGTEILKTPGYVVGGLAAIANETLGDGKNSMSLAIDNAWINQFESLDEKLKSYMPVHISKDIEDGNLWDKASSGSWWATQGADGAGFMLAMFAPGAATKLMGTGKAIASLTEVLANTRTGKLITDASKSLKFSNSANEIAGITDDTYRISNSFARNADGVTAALVNTTLESMAEAGDTFKQHYNTLKDKVKSGEMSDSEARTQAGSKASGVFKSNMTLLMISNLLEQQYIWKAFGSGNDSVISKVIKDGQIDFDKLSSLGNKGYKQLLSEFGQGIGKNALKEGLFEEGLQTIIQQNEEKGKSGLGNAVKELGSQIVNGIFKGDDTFWDNSELHESMFLGSALGGGMGIVGQIKENNDLKRQLQGFDNSAQSQSAISKLAQKTGFKRDTPDSKGLVHLIKDSWIKNFKTDYKSLLDQDGKLDSEKVKQAFEQPDKEYAIHALYDAAVAVGDEVSANKYANYLAQNYVQPFLGQVGMDKVFSEHVKTQVVPAWKERFESQNKRTALPDEVSKFQEDFTESGNRVFRAYNEAERTNYPERYFRDNSSDQEYAKFRQSYFNGKFDVLLQLDSLNLTRSKLNDSLNKSGLLSKYSLVNNRLEPNDKSTSRDKIQIAQYNTISDSITKDEERLNSLYSKFFTKEGVKEIYDLSKEDDNIDLEKENEDLKNKVEEKKEKVKETVTKISEKQDKGETVLLKNNKTGEVKEVYVDNTGVKFESLIVPKSEIVDSTIVSDAEKSVTNDSEIVFEKPNDSVNNDIPLSNKEDLLVDNSIADPENNSEDSIEKIKESLDTLGEDIANLRNALEEEKLLLDENFVEEIQYEDKTNTIIELGKLNITDRITTGRHVVYNKLPNGVMYDVLDSDGLPLLGTKQQQLWQNTLDTLTINSTANVMTIGFIKESNPDLYEQILKSAENVILKDNDLWVVLLDKNKPIKVKNDYVFTSLYTPETLYKDMNSSRVTKKYMMKLYGVEEPSDYTLKRQYEIDVFENAKTLYTNWYNSIVLQKSVILSIDHITDGHQVTLIKDGEIQQNNAYEHLPKGSRLEISTNGKIEVNGELIDIQKGDIVAKHNNRVFPLRTSLLNDEQIEQVIEMFKMVTPDTPIQDIRLSGRFAISEYESVNSIGVFYDKDQVPLMQRLIKYGGSGNYSINVVTDKKSKDNVFIRIIKDNQSRLILISDLNNKNSNSYKDLVEFLKEKRFNVNKKLLNTTTTLVDVTNSEKNTRIDYNDYILKNHLTTTNFIKKGYPATLQRNIVFGSPTLDQIENNTIVKEKRKSRKEVAKQADLEIDKILTTDQLLNQKILSGEIKKFCK